MKFLLFDDINTTIAKDSLENALKARGHEVISTQRFSRSHKLLSDKKEIDFIWGQVEQAISNKPDVMVNFRPPTLLPEMVEKLKKAGIFSMTWFTDDPVLYEICYKHVIECYDFILHAGGEKILDFYDARHQNKGVNFPFWVDDSIYKYVYDPENALYDIGFMGTCIGSVKSGRYDLISSLPFSKRIFGVVKYDIDNIWGGYLQSAYAINRAFGRAKFALNIPQFFTDYQTHDYYFSGLEELGFYEYPSRIPQYAAIGVPIIYYGIQQPLEAFPEAIACMDQEAIIHEVNTLINDVGRLKDLSQRTYQRFQTSFSAMSRVMLLEAIIKDAGSLKKLDSHERALIFAKMMKGHPPQSEKQVRQNHAVMDLSNAHFPSLSDSVDMVTQFSKKKYRSANRYRILFLHNNNLQLGEIQRCLVRALKNLGHEVTIGGHKNIQGEETQPFLFPDEHIKPIEGLIEDIAQQEQPQIVCVFGENEKIPQAFINRIRANGGVTVNLLYPGSKEYLERNIDRYDFFTTSSGELIGHFKNLKKKISYLPAAIDQKSVNIHKRTPEFLVCQVISSDAWLEHAKKETTGDMLSICEKNQMSLRVYKSLIDLYQSGCLNYGLHEHMLRGGKFHLYNLQPGTSRDETLISLMQSISKGGVVFINRENTIEPYFNYDSEIIGYTSIHDLHNQLDLLNKKRSIYLSVRERAVHRLIQNHILEEKLGDLLDIVEELHPGPGDQKQKKRILLSKQPGISGSWKHMIEKFKKNQRITWRSRHNYLTSEHTPAFLAGIPEKNPLKIIAFRMLGHNFLNRAPKPIRDSGFKALEFSKKIGRAMPTSIREFIRDKYLKIINKGAS